MCILGKTQKTGPQAGGEKRAKSLGPEALRELWHKTSIRFLNNGQKAYKIIGAQSFRFEITNLLKGGQRFHVCLGPVRTL